MPITVTRQMLDQGAAPGGGWSLEQIQLFGLTGFVKGWKKSIIGRSVSKLVVDEFIALRGPGSKRYLRRLANMAEKKARREANMARKAEHVQAKLAEKVKRVRAGGSSVGSVMSYRDRDKVIRALGYSSYPKYCAGPLWKGIRERVMSRSGWTCLICREQAVVVHHIRYTVENLTGGDLEWLVSLCISCHHRVEFDEAGSKRTIGQAQRMLEWLTSKEAPAETTSEPSVAELPPAPAPTPPPAAPLSLFGD